MTHLRARILLAALAVMPLVAQTPSPAANHPIIAVVHLDFLPTHLDAVPALNAYVAQAAHDPNILRIELLQQIGASNHYTLVETLRNRAAYDTHIAAPATLRFRALIAPALGAPYDERLHTDATPLH